MATHTPPQRGAGNHLRTPPSHPAFTPLLILCTCRPKHTFLPLPAPTSPKRKDHMDHTHSLIPSFYLCRRTRQTPRAKFPPSSDALNQSRRIEIYPPLLPSSSSKETSFEGKRREGGGTGGGFGVGRNAARDSAPVVVYV